MDRTITYANTSNLSVAAAILSMGIELSQPAVKTVNDQGATRYIFIFNETDATGTIHTKDLLKQWYDDDFPGTDDECEFSFIKTAFKNREVLLDQAKQCKEYKVVRHGKKICLIGEDCTPEYVKRIIRK